MVHRSSTLVGLHRALLPRLEVHHPAVLGTIVFVYGGWVFIRGAWGELADRKPGMMTLISLAIVVAFGTSLAATFGFFEIDVLVGTRVTDYDHAVLEATGWKCGPFSQARGALNYALAALLPGIQPETSEGRGH